MKKLLFIIALGGLIYSCSDGTENKETAKTGDTENKKSDYDPEVGVGRFTDVDISPNLDAAKAAKGKEVYEVKCASCHKLSDERVVGPGWAAVTERRKPEWILNFITNVDEMLNKDPEAQAQLEICLVRMPNQNLTDADALAVFEFMRQNDGLK